MAKSPRSYSWGSQGYCPEATLNTGPEPLGTAEMRVRPLAPGCARATHRGPWDTAPRLWVGLGLAWAG